MSVQTISNNDLANSLDELKALMLTGFEAMNARFDRLEERVDRLEERMDHLESRMDSLEAVQRETNIRLDSLEAGQREPMLCCTNVKPATEKRTLD